MSNNVDERIVEMRFDNKQFESGVQTSIRSLDNLKAGLNLDASAQSLSNLERAGRSFSLAGIADGVDHIASKFSALSVIGMTALANITNSAINAGARMVSSFTIDPIKSGFQEYETKMNAIQTILTNTQGGQKKAITQNATALKASSDAAVKAQRDSNAESLNNLQKSQAQELKAYQKSADEELKVLQNKNDEETAALEASIKVETEALNKAHDEKLALYDNESQALDTAITAETAALNKVHDEKLAIYDNETAALKQSIKDETDALQKAHDAKLSQYQEEYMSKLKVIDEAKYNEIKAIDDQIKGIKDLTASEQAQIKKTEEQKKLNDLQTLVRTAKTSKERIAAEQNLADYRDKLQREQLLADRDAKIASLETEKTNVTDKYAIITDQLKTEYTTKMQNEQDNFKLESDNLKTQQAEKLKALNETHTKQIELMQIESDTLKAQQVEKIKALNEAHKVGKENIKIETELLKDQQDEKLKALRKTYQEERALIQDRQNTEKDNIKERQDAELEAIRKRNEASASAAQSSGGGGAGGPVQYEITKGSSLEDVNKALAELNTYADKTIYNFAQMTDNVGKFTAAGLSLNDSVTTVKGLSNVAAGFGVDATRMAGATYQMSQALSAGVVKLQDWKSMEQASMGGTLIQNALRDTAKDMGIFVNEAIPFRESLESGWLTTDVFVKTMDKMANDPALLQAATQVKTYTQLVDTLKESMGSGWATTWENIIGNKDEAAALFTAINDGLGGMITSSANARNAMLQFWGDNGGRTMIIDGLTNSFKALEAILAPIGEAFRTIFPPMTGQRLLEISKSFLDLTTTFKIGEETSKNIKSTFEGLFAVLDIAGQGFKFVAQCVGLLVGALAPGAGGLLSVTAGVGDFLVAFDNMVKQSGFFSKALEIVAFNVGVVKQAITLAVDAMSAVFGKASEALSPYLSSIKDAISNSDLFAKAIDGIRFAFTFVATGLSEVIDKIKGVSTELGGVDLGGTTTFSEKLSGAFTLLSEAGDRVKETFKNVIPIFLEVGSTIKDFFGPAVEYIIDKFKQISLMDVGAALAGGGILIFAKSIKDFLGSVSNVTKGFNDVISGISGSLEAFQTKIKAEAILKIAMAIGLLAASVFVLASIDQESLGKALAALTTIFLELGGSLMMLDKVSSATPGMTGKLIALGVAVLLIATAMKSISSLDQNGIQNGIQGLAAILMLLAAFTKITSGTGGIQGSISGIIGLSLGILILTKAVENFGNLDQAVLERGIQGIASALISLGLFIKLIGNPEHMVAVGLGITGIAVAMNIFAGAVALFGLMSLETLGKGIVSMAAILMSITLMMKLLPNDAQLIATGVALNLMAIALYGIAGAVAIFGNMSIETLAIGIAALAAALLVMAASANLMTGTLSGAAALLVMALAINMLVPAIALLGNMDLKTIGVALLAIAGIFVILGLSALVLAPLAPVIMTLAGSIALLGLGVAAIGGGLVLFAAGLAAIAVGGGAFIAAIVAIAVAIFDLIPQIATKIGEGVVAFADAIAKGMPEIVKALAAIATALIQVFVDVIPPLMDAAMKLLLALINKINEYIEPITNAGMKLIIGFLKGIRDNTQEFTKVAIELLMEFIKGISDEIPDIIKLGADLVLNCIKGISDTIPKFVDAGFKMIIDFINGLTKAVDENMPVLLEAIARLAGAIIDGLAKGLIGGAVTIIKAIEGIGTALVDGFKELLGIHSPSRVFDELGGYVIEGLVNGLNAGVGWVKDTIFYVGSNMAGGLKEWVGNFVDIGKNMMDGIITGVTSMATKVTDTVKGIGSAGVDGLKNLLGIHSPSRVFGEIGKFSMMGFANGISDFAGNVSDEAMNAGKSAMDSLKSAVANISDIVGDNVDMNPTIRPVLDLSNVTTGAEAINSLLNKNTGITVSSANIKTASIASSMTNNTSLQNGSGIVSTLKEILTTNPQPINVTVISQLDGREVARVTAPAMSEELAYLNNKNNFVYGRG